MTCRVSLDIEPGAGLGWIFISLVACRTCIGTVWLGSVSWTAYPTPDEPGVFTTPKGFKDLKSGGVAVEVPIGQSIPENGQGFSTGNEVWVDATKPYVDYKVSLTGYAPQGSSATMVSPVFDDITISFYLPKEEVLLTERMTD